MNRKWTALLLAMTFILSTVVPSAATAQTGKAGSGKTAAVSVEKPKKGKSKFAAFVEKLLGVKDAKDDKKEKTLKKTTPATTDSGSNNGSNGESGKMSVQDQPARVDALQNENSGKDKNNENNTKEEDKVKFTFSLIDESGKNLSGAFFSLTNEAVKDDSKQEIRWASDKNPKELELEPGKYQLKMIVPPEGYKESSAEFEIVKSDNHDEFNIVSEKLTFAQVDKKLTMKAEKKKEESKIFFSLRGIDDKELAGVKVKIVEKDTDKAVQEWTSGEKPFPYTLMEGEYKFKLADNKLPDGYKLEKESIDFKITKEGKIEADKAHLKNNEDGTQTLFLKVVPIGDPFFFSLKDSNGKDIIGPELQIKDSAGKVIRWFSEKNLKGIDKSEFSNGIYEFSQTTVPYGYTAAEPIRFEVKDKKIVRADYGLTNLGPYQELRLVSKSTSNTNARYDVTFSKVDAAGKAFPGTVVELYKDGKVINFWSSGTEAKTINLESGVYRYHEKLNPEGHKAAADFEFEVKADGTISLSNVQAGENVKLKEGRAIVVGEPGSVPAQDPNKKPEQKPGQNNQQKPGQTNPNDKKAGTENTWVEFSLTKRSGGELSGIIAEIYQGSTMVESWTSTDLSYLTRLQPGTYRFHVKTVPTGFAAPKDFEFTVNKDGSITLGTIPAGETVTVKGGLITVIFETKAAAAAIAGGTTAQGGTKSNLPKTGDGISPVVYAAAIGVIGAVTLGIGLKKRKEGIDEAK